MDKADLMLYNKAYNNAPDEGATPEDDRTVQPGVFLARSPGAASKISLARKKPGHKRPGGPVRNNKDETSTFCLPRQSKVGQFISEVVGLCGANQCKLSHSLLPFDYG